MSPVMFRSSCIIFNFTQFSSCRCYTEEKFTPTRRRYLVIVTGNKIQALKNVKCNCHRAARYIYMLWFSFILGLIFIFFCFKLIITNYHNQKQKKIKIKPRIKLNPNIYITIIHRSGGGQSWIFTELRSSEVISTTSHRH